jgi:hypothetical protein
MKPSERERLTKAHQSARQLLADVRDLHAQTENVALEELALKLIEQVAEISRLLGRLSKAR